MLGGLVVGGFRLVLALCVLLSHAGVDVWGWNPGVVAVISFFLLSGYVMTLLIKKYYASADRVTDFYVDRAARLFPQFLFYCLATGVLMATAEVSSPFLGGCEVHKIGLNLLILPLEFFQFRSLGLENCMLVPQAWSLGLEMSFYLVAPAIVLLSKTARWLVVGSVTVFLVAYFGLINTDTYGYRLLPGVLFIFVVGAASANHKDKLPWIVWAGASLLFVVLLLDHSLFSLPYNKEVLLGLIIGIPALGVLKVKRFSVWDERIGNLSYGVFLNYFFCIWLMQSLLGLEITRIQPILSLLALSTTMGLMSYYLIERPALRWRRTVRYRLSR